MNGHAVHGAHWLHFALLQGAEKLCLEVDGHVGDFVQEDRAVRAGFEQSLAGLHRAGESSLHIAEEFRFDERGYQSGTVHGHERLFAARAGKMDGAGHEFLARPALPENQHRIIVLAHLLDHFVHALHFGGDANEAAETWAAAQLFAQDTVFLVEFDGVQQAVQLAAQLVDVEWFRHVVGSAQPCGLHGRFNRAVLRQHQHRHLRIGSPHALEEFNAPQRRHFQVGEHNVYRVLLQDFEGLLGGGRRAHKQTGFTRHVRAQISCRGFVVHNQDAADGRRRFARGIHLVGHRSCHGPIGSTGCANSEC